MTMADTVAVMNHGRIEQLGSPQELYELPRTGFVASFLGQSNLFPAQVESTSGGLITARTAGGVVALPAERAVVTSGAVTVGVRPEKLRLLSEEPARDGLENVLGPGRIVDVSFAGASTQYVLEIPGLGDVTVFEQNMVFGSVFTAGSEVWVAWRREHTFGLDAAARVEAAEAARGEEPEDIADARVDGEAA